MKKVFLDNLPRWTEGANIGKINWSESVGKNVKFVFCNIEGYIEIIKNENKTLTIQYNDNTYKCSHKSFVDCNFGKTLNLNREDFKFKVGDTFKDSGRNITIIDMEYRTKRILNDKGKVRTNNRKWYKYKCNKCGWDEGWIRENGIAKGTGCSCCCNRIAVLGINTIWDTDRWMCDLGVSEEDAKKHTKSSGKKIEVVCPDCRETKIIKINTIFGCKTIGCMCGDGFSYPEKLMFSVLKQLNVDFKTQYSPSYLIRTEIDKKSRKYSDFYLPDYQLVIETDGKIGHKGGVVYDKLNTSLQDQIKVDEWKDEQHLKNGVKTIRIDCFKSDMEYIKENIYRSELSKIFDLSKIDWLTVEKFALSNLVKEVCEYWNNKGDKESVVALAEKFKIDRNTVVSYLKKGTASGLTYYDADEQKRNNYKEIGNITRKLLSKKVEMFDSKYTSLGEFGSATQIEKISLQNFGEKLYKDKISAVCRGDIESYKGFKFKYI